MDIKDLLQAAMNKDANAFEAAFSDIMSEKMSSAVETKYNSMFEEDYKKKMKEDDDNDEEEDDDMEDEDEDEDEDEEDE